ncbi:MAG: cobalt-precorrin-5B (C(1))-methyltransferase, partial [Clostridia bacterium]|nr:cobalt-precorrin-5B (C(1))-methyltransferase [Clostridia bacterium]
MAVEKQSDVIQRRRQGPLRSGFTTGACATAAAKAATLLLLGAGDLAEVAIVLPQGQRVTFPLHR